MRTDGTPPNEMLAYVHWYTPPQIDNRSRFRRISKLMRGHDRAGGVISLNSIRFPCPLGTAIDGPCPPGLDQYNAYEQADSFWINAFDSHEAFELFR